MLNHSIECLSPSFFTHDRKLFDVAAGDGLYAAHDAASDTGGTDNYAPNNAQVFRNWTTFNRESGGYDHYFYMESKLYCVSCMIVRTTS